VHAAPAAEERRRLRRRSMDGMNRAAAEGRYVGGIVPFGYRVEGHRPRARLVPDDVLLWGTWSAADVVRHIYNRLALDRWSCIRISEELNALGVPTAYAREGRGVRGKRTAGVWRAARVRNLVVNATYRGEHHYGKRAGRRREVIVAAVPRLVSDEVWHAAHETLRANRLNPGLTRQTYLLRSVMRCALCGLTYVGTRSRGVTWYRCGGQMRERGRFEGRCVGKGVRAEQLERVIWADIESWLREPGTLLDELRQEANADSADAVREASRMALQAALDALVARRQKRLDQHERGHITDAELDQAIDQIAVEQQEIASRLADLLPEAADPATLPLSLVEELRERLDAGLAEPERQEIVRHLVASVLVSTEVDAAGKKRAQAVVEYRFPPGVVVDICTDPIDCESGCCSHYPHGCPCGTAIRAAPAPARRPPCRGISAASPAPSWTALTCLSTSRASTTASSPAPPPAKPRLPSARG
jgi:site-specific DNA recombinase